MHDRISVIKGDITALDVDAIVNAANEALRPGGGVDGAIRRAAGPGLTEETRRIGHCATGDACITGGHNLRARHVIHTVGPVWRGGADDEDALLARCYRNSLHLAAEHGVRTIAFPAISTGIYHFPVARAARIAVAEVMDFLRHHALPEKVIFVGFDDATCAAFRAALDDAVA